MVKFLLLVMSLVNTSLLDGKMVEMEPLTWKEYERKAYAYRWTPFGMPIVKIPFNRPPIRPYYEMSEYSRKWLKKRNATRDAYRLTVPQYYMTPFITRDHTQDLDK